MEHVTMLGAESDGAGGGVVERAVGERNGGARRARRAGGGRGPGAGRPADAAAVFG
jgi:hypothetical protein